MLSSVLHTRAAIDTSLLIARAFVGLRRMATAHKEPARSLAKLECGSPDMTLRFAASLPLSRR